MWFYLSKLWFWWLLAVVLAAVLTAYVCRWRGRPRKAVVDDRQARALAEARADAARHEAKVNELLSSRARDLDEVAALRTQAGLLDDLRGQVRSLEAKAGEVPSLEAEIRTLRAEAAKLAPLQAELVGARREVGDLKADNARLTPLQTRLADLEAEVAQGAALQARLAELEAEAADGRDARAELQGLRGRVEHLEGEAAAAVALRARVAELEEQATSAAAPVAALGLVGAASTAGAESGSGDELAAAQARVAELEAELAATRDALPVDTSGSAAVLGKRVTADDLKVVEGIGPKIEELLVAGGVATWRQLAAATADRLREILDAAGPRYQIHDPSSWPRQAELLAGARWAEFKDLTDRLKGGRG